MYANTILLSLSGYVTDLCCIDDRNRCRLNAIPGVEGSDYINASFVDVSFYPVKISGW